MPAVVAEDLVKVYPGSKRAGSLPVRALDGVSLAVEEGTVLGLLGPNGAGKTTAVRVLTTLLRPDSGRASVNGIDVLADPAEVRRSIGLAGQYAAIDEKLTGSENLTLVGRLNHLSGQQSTTRAGQLLERFGLADAGGRQAKTYSGGMRRRLDLAAALVTRPPVLFLDEPTTGLDPRSRIELWGVIEELVADGTTLLLTTQYLEEADRLTDNICVVDHGKVIAEGTAAALKGRLGGTVVEVTLADPAAAALAAGELRGAGNAEPTVAQSTVRLGVDQGPRGLAEVVRRLDAAGLEPSGLVVREPSLDDVFLTLTGHSPDDPAPPTHESEPPAEESA